jgi:hypothetical protein
MIWDIACLFIGAFLGIFMMCLMVAGRSGDRS